VNLDFDATVVALRDSVTARVVDRDVVWVDGPDARTYLQGQLSQDIDTLVAGGVEEALVLSPQGKIDGYVRVIRTDEERFAVEIEAGYGEAVLERLRRFKIRVKATLELERTSCVEVRGPDARTPDGNDDGVLVVPYAFGALAGHDLLGAGATVPEGVALGDDLAFEQARIVAGVPRMGREITDKTIPAEAGLVGRTVSFTKGCYTGQELVARLDARGNRVPWNLRSLTFPGEIDGDGEHPLVVGDAAVGRVTSAVFSPTDSRTLALGYLKRDFAVPGSAGITTTSGPAVVAVEALPAERG
jgi:folate-binding protein YgfZ